MRALPTALGVLACVILVLGCSQATRWRDPSEVDADLHPGSDADGDTDADTDADTDTDADVDTDADADPDTDTYGECDIVRGTGCNSREKCAVFTRDGVRLLLGCVPISPDDMAAPGGPCFWLSDPYFGGYDNCPSRYFCLERPGVGQVCEKLCSEADRAACRDAYPDPAGALTGDGLCIYSLGDEMPWPGLMACAGPSGCDPTCQDCGGGPEVGCYPATDGITVGTLCVEVARDAPGAGVTGDRCDFVNACAPGYMCLESGCRPFCDLRGETGCEWSVCGRHDGDAEGSCVPASALGLPLGEPDTLGLCVE